MIRQRRDSLADRIREFDHLVIFELVDDLATLDRLAIIDGDIVEEPPCRLDAAIRLLGGGGPGQKDEKQRKEHRLRSEEHTSELQSLMRISYAVFCLKKKKNKP